MHTAFFEQFNLPPDARILSIHAHPDDEVVESGGFLAAAQAYGTPTHLAHATVGGGSTEGDPAFVQNGGRIAEAAAVAEALDIPPGRQHNFGLPDGRLARYPHRNQLISRLTGLIVEQNITHLFLPGLHLHETRPHPDHRTVRQAGQAVGRYLAHLGWPVQVWQQVLPAQAPPDAVSLAVHTGAKLQLLAKHRSQFRFEPHPGEAATHLLGRDMPTDTARRLTQYLGLFTAEHYAPYVPGPVHDWTRAGQLVLAATK